MTKEIAEKLLEPNGQKRQWCSCHEGDLDDWYLSEKENFLKDLVTALDSARQEARQQAFEEAAKIVEESMFDALGQNEKAEVWLASLIRAKAREEK